MTPGNEFDFTSRCIFSTGYPGMCEKSIPLNVVQLLYANLYPTSPHLIECKKDAAPSPRVIINWWNWEGIISRHWHKRHIREVPDPTDHSFAWDYSPNLILLPLFHIFGLKSFQRNDLMYINFVQWLSTWVTHEPLIGLSWLGIGWKRIFTPNSVIPSYIIRMLKKKEILMHWME